MVKIQGSWGGGSRLGARLGLGVLCCVRKPRRSHRPAPALKALPSLPDQFIEEIGLRVDGPCLNLKRTPE